MVHPVVQMSLSISKSNTSVEFMKISEIVVIIFIKHCVSMALELFHVCEDKF